MKDVQIQQIAQRLRDLRAVMGFSVETMANASGKSLDDYLALESGEKDFSFTFLHNCAKVLGVDITVLISGDVPKLGSYTVSRKGEGLPYERREGFQYKHLASFFKSKLSEPFYVSAKYSEELDNAEIELANHSGEEFDYILKGSLKVRFGDHYEILNEGDSVYYNSGVGHGMVATGGQDCEFLAIVMKPYGAESPSEYQPSVITDTIADEAVEGLEPIYKRFITVTKNKDGQPRKIDFHYDDTFNFTYDVVDELAKKCPDKCAMQWVSVDKDTEKFSFSDMSRYSAMSANYFKSLGIKKGDRVMVVLKRHYQFWFVLLGLHRIGAIAVPATNLLLKKDYEYRFNAAGVSTIICTASGDAANQVEQSLPLSPTIKTKIIVGGRREGWNNYDEDIKNFSDSFERPCGEQAVKASDIMVMYFTSGTTGYPKIACHDFTYPLGHFTTAKYWHNVDPDGLHLTISETGWAKALWGKLYGQWLCEAGIFTYDFDRFDPKDILPMFEQFQITTFCAPPTMYRIFIKEDLGKYNLSSLKHATIAGEALNPEVYQQFLNATGLGLMEGYGQTETTLTVSNFRGTTPKPGSMGKPSPQYDIDIVLPDGKPAKTGEVGEIVIRTGANKPVGMFCGYYLDDKQTNETWRDGVYYTGDTAWRDEDGYFWYVGRTDDLIKSSGYRIGPFEIESVIMELPYVLECAVTGMPDPIRGQVVKATVVLVKGHKPSDTLASELQEYVKAHTAPYKYPRIVEFVNELPKTISGKIRRVELR